MLFRSSRSGGLGNTWWDGSGVGAAWGSGAGEDDVAGQAGIAALAVGVAGLGGAVALVALANAVGDETHLVVTWVRDTDTNGLAVDVGWGTGAEAALLGRQGRGGGRTLGALGSRGGDEEGENLSLHFDCGDQR